MNAKPILITFAGAARSGKTSAVAICQEYLPDALTISMADPLKDGIDAIFGIECRSADMEARKEQPLAPLDVSLRVLMQTLGTEWGRNMIDPNIWIKLVERKITRSTATFVLIPDIRFDNERTMVHDNGGVVLHILRPGIQAVGKEGHASEIGITALPEKGDRYIINDGTLEDLKFKVLEAVDEVTLDLQRGERAHG